TPRRRRRTRGGAPVDAALAGSAPAAETAGTEDTQAATRTPRRRRRTRSGASGQPVTPAVAPVTAAETAVESAAVETVATAEGPT
ncbi:hypothetical protein GT346_20290, partial [Streptomyces sp. SID161]|nr:hypothetical protein [Streptomyces sp. SID161]